MTWIAVLLLTIAAFAAAIIAFRLDRRYWTTLAAALVFGLAGYALQARPDLAGAPAAVKTGEEASEWDLVAAREEMISERFRSRSDKLLIADALARRGQTANAAAMLRSATEENPQDSESWLALANVLVEHTDGVLTPPALFAFRQAAGSAPESPAPGYFLGLALIRQGSLLEARQVWESALASSADEAPRALLAERLARLDSVLTQVGALSSAAPESNAPANGGSEGQPASPASPVPPAEGTGGQ